MNDPKQPTFENKLESAIHLVGCQAHDLGYNCAIDDSETIEKVEELEEKLLSEIKALILSDVVGEDRPVTFKGDRYKDGDTVKFDTDTDNIDDIISLVIANDRNFRNEEQRSIINGSKT